MQNFEAPLHWSGLFLILAAAVIWCVLFIRARIKEKASPEVYDERSIMLENAGYHHGFWAIVLCFFLLDCIADRQESEAINKSYVFLMVLTGYTVYAGEMTLRGIMFQGARKPILFSVFPMFSAGMVLLLLGGWKQEPPFHPVGTEILVSAGWMAGLSAVMFLCGVIRLRIDRRELEDE